MNKKDFAWLIEHSDEVAEKYAGKWIAVRQGEIVGVGDTATQASEQARKSGDGPFVLEGIDRNADVIYGASEVRTSHRNQPCGKATLPLTGFALRMPSPIPRRARVSAPKPRCRPALRPRNPCAACPLSDTSMTARNPTTSCAARYLGRSVYSR